MTGISASPRASRPRLAEWTRDMVEERVVEAAEVLKQLPGLRPQGYFGTWPEIQRTAKELAQAMPVPMRRPPPSSASISRMEEAITCPVARGQRRVDGGGHRLRDGRARRAGAVEEARALVKIDHVHAFRPRLPLRWRSP